MDEDASVEKIFPKITESVTVDMAVLVNYYPIINSISVKLVQTPRARSSHPERY